MRRGTEPARSALLVILVLSIASSAPCADGPRQLTLKPHPKLPNGKAVAIEGTTGGKAHEFVVENLSVLQPVVVTLVAKNPGDVIKLTLGKDRFNKGLDVLSTQGSAIATRRLRTQGDLTVSISAERSSPYGLLVWAGDEVKPEFERVVRSPKPAERVGRKWPLWVSIVMVAIAGLVLVFRRRGRVA